MDAKIAEIESNLYTALSNVKKIKAAYMHAIETGLGDEVKAMTAGSLDLLKSIIDSSHFREGLANSSGPDRLQFVPIAEEYADKVLKESERALEKMQVAHVTAATERKRAREEEGKTKENEDCEEPGKKKAKKDEAKEGEASNKPGGSNA